MGADIESCSWCEGTGKVMRIAYGEDRLHLGFLGVIVPVAGVMVPCPCPYCRGTKVVPAGTDYMSKG